MTCHHCITIKSRKSRADSTLSHTGEDQCLLKTGEHSPTARDFLGGETESGTNMLRKGFENCLLELVSRGHPLFGTGEFGLNYTAHTIKALAETTQPRRERAATKPLKS